MLPGLRGSFVWPSWGRRTNQCKHWTGLELESLSCLPADVPLPHVLMAFYGSLESLWLLLTQWDSLHRGGLERGGFQREGRPQYIADAKTLKHKERRHCEASEDILTFGFVDLICIFVSFVCCGLFFFLLFSLSCSYVQNLHGVALRWHFS